MKRDGRTIRWNGTAIAGFGAAAFVIFLASQLPNFLWAWPWGPSTGYRSAGLTSGHYERQFPAILRGKPRIGLVFLGGDERLVLDYEVTVEEGKLSFGLWKKPIVANRPRHVGPRLIAANDSGRIEFASEGAGIYEIAFYAYSLQGAVEVDWRTLSAEQRADAGNDSSDGG